MALMGKIEWRLIVNLVIAFQIIITCFDLSVLVFIFSKHCYKPFRLGIVSQGLVDLKIRLADYDPHLPNWQQDFFRNHSKYRITSSLRSIHIRNREVNN